MHTIPDSVLDKITAHRPHLAGLVANLRGARSLRLVRLIEKRLADAYLSGETALLPTETYYLAACAAGRPYGTTEQAQHK